MRTTVLEKVAKEKVGLHTHARTQTRTHARKHARASALPQRVGRTALEIREVKGYQKSRERKRQKRTEASEPSLGKSSLAGRRELPEEKLLEVGPSYPQEQPRSLTSLVGFSDGDSSDEQVSRAKKSHLFPTDLDVSGGVHLERESMADFELSCQPEIREQSQVGSPSPP